jgi:hypothetical protein
MFGDADDDQIAFDAQPFVIFGIFHGEAPQRL